MICAFAGCDEPPDYVVGQPSGNQRGMVYRRHANGDFVYVCREHGRSMIADGLTRGEAVLLEPMLT